MRHIIVFDFDDNPEIVNTAGEKVSQTPDDRFRVLDDPKPTTDPQNTEFWQKLREQWLKPQVAPEPEADIKPELTEAQIRARHREAVTRGMAVVDKALLDLQGEPSAIRRMLRYSFPFSSKTGAVDLLTDFVQKHINYGTPEPLPRPRARATFLHEVRVDSGGFRGNVPLTPELVAFVDKYKHTDY